MPDGNSVWWEYFNLGPACSLPCIITCVIFVRSDNFALGTDLMNQMRTTDWSFIHRFDIHHYCRQTTTMFHLYIGRGLFKIWGTVQVVKVAKIWCLCKINHTGYFLNVKFQHAFYIIVALLMSSRNVVTAVSQSLDTSWKGPSIYLTTWMWVLRHCKMQQVLAI